MKRDRTNTMIDVEFEWEGHKEEVSIWVPFPIFIEAVKKTFEDSLVSIDGTDNAIWNSFVDLEMINKFEDSENFVNHCKELYKGSSFEEEDYEDWVEEYRDLNDIGAEA